MRSSLKPEKTTIAVPGEPSRIIGIAARPSSLGIEMSSSTTSGRVSSTPATPASPSPASPTTSTAPSSSSAKRISRRNELTSSQRNTRTGCERLLVMRSTLWMPADGAQPAGGQHRPRTVAAAQPEALDLVGRALDRERPDAQPDAVALSHQARDRALDRAVARLRAQLDLPRMYRVRPPGAVDDVRAGER